MLLDAGWTAYNDHQADRGPRPPRPHLLRLLELAGPGGGRRALDLGAGNGVESLAMARAGWRVTAIDGDEGGCARLAEAARESAAGGELGDGGVEVLHADFTALPELPACELAYSGYALPFAAGAFPAVWARLESALAPGGWLGADLFGPRDTWARSSRVAIHAPDALPELLDGFELVDVAERDEDGWSLKGEKHWHVLSVIARRRA